MWVNDTAESIHRHVAAKDADHLAGAGREIKDAPDADKFPFSQYLATSSR